MSHTLEVDSWRFMPPRLARLIRARAESEPGVESIPFTPLSVPLREARVALLSTAGISYPPDRPFDMDGERANPMWGDPSWRRIPFSATAADIEVNHLHIHTAYIQRDLNVALPLQRICELAVAGEIGSVAPSHYSVMGFQLDSTVQTRDSAPAIAAAMKREGVHAVVLAPV